MNNNGCVFQSLGDKLDEAAGNHRSFDDIISQLSDWLNDKQYELDQCCQITPDKSINEAKLQELQV